MNALQIIAEEGPGRLIAEQEAQERAILAKRRRMH